MAPGPAYIATTATPEELNLAARRQDLELVPGLQTVRFGLTRASNLHFEFRVDGAALRHEDAIFHGLSRCIRAVGHDGRAGAIR